MRNLNYRNLDFVQFESLAKDIMSKKLGISLQRFGEGKDGGIDLTDDTVQHKIIVQCKHYAKSSSSDTVTSLKKELPKLQALDPQPEKYYIFTSSSLLPQQVKDLRQTFSAYMDSDEQIIYNEKIVDFFNDPSSEDILKKHQELVDSRPDWLKKDEVQIRLIGNFIPNDNAVIGRETKLQEIASALSKNNVVFIRGMGGIGKSVLAKKFAEDNKNDYDIIIEVSADSFRSAILGIGLANWNGVSLDDETLFAVKLQKIKDLMMPQKTLLIVHDYNTSEDLEARWRELPCHCLITTWNSWKNVGKQIHLKENDLSEEDAVKIFKYYYCQGNEEYEDILVNYLSTDADAVHELVNRVEHHALSIKVLAKQMSCEEDDLIRPKEMLQRFSFDDEKEFLNIHEAGSGSSPENATALQHLKRIFSLSCANGRLSEEQLEALRYMTLTSPIAGISPNRFCKWTGIQNRNNLRQLEKCGWIEFNLKGIDYLDASTEKQGIYRIPMVIAEILQQESAMKCSISNSETMIACFMKCELDNMKSYNQRNALKKQTQAIVSQFTPESLEKYTDILSKSGVIYFETAVSLEDRIKGLQYKKEALEIRRNILGENHYKVANDYNDVGVIYDELGNSEKGIEYQQKALEIRRQLLGENHLDTAESYNNLGRCFGSLGDIKKELEFHKKALEIRRNILGENHSLTAQSYNNIGLSEWNLGNRQQGIEYTEKALKIRRQVLGENHSDTAFSYHNMGMYYYELGDYKKGLEYLEKALKIVRQVLGENHSQMAYIYNSIGGICGKLGDSKKDLEYQEKALEIRRQVLGENHPDTANSLNNVGVAYWQLGDRQKGLEYQEKALEILSILPGKHSSTAQVYKNVGDCYKVLGDCQKGLEYQEKALEIYRHVLGENHLDTANSLNNVGITYWELGDRQKGLEYLEKALEIFRSLSEKHSDTAIVYENVGVCYEALGDRQKGLEYQEKALETRRQVLGENHLDTARSYNNVGNGYADLGDQRKGLEYREKALEIKRKVLGENHSDTAHS